jgi:hypothetical protein
MVSKGLNKKWNEAFIAYIYVLSWHLPGDTRATTENVGQDTWFPGLDSNWALPEYKQEALPLSQFAHRGPE